MHPEHLMTLPCTLVAVTQDGPPDEYGNPTEQTVETATTCWLHQTARDESTFLENVQDETFALYLPPGETVDGVDRIEVQGGTYEFTGPPWLAYNPRQRRSTHWQATIRRTT